MANAFCDIRIVTVPLAIPPAASDGRAGAAVDFLGIVRGLEEGKEIAGIEYEANETMALHELKKIAARVGREFGCEDVIAWHRVGLVPVGEASVFVRATAAHRAAAFDACRAVIEEIKKSLPVWKQFVPVAAPADRQ
jgi:molybdopterin synthase catalytic subunit